MYQIIMRFKSGNEYNFKCKSYKIHTTVLGELILFEYNDGIGECPIYYNPKEVESIAVIEEEKTNDEIVVMSNCCKPSYKKI